MKPENHAIRKLKAQLKDATVLEANAIERVIVALTACIENSGDKAALGMCRRGLETELIALEKLRGSR